MIALGGEPLDGGDLLAGGIGNRRLAGPHGFAVEVDRASATKARAATELGAGHLQLLADDPQQRRVVGRLDGHIPSVDIEIRHLSPLPVYEAAYGGSSLLGLGWRPPGKRQLPRQ